MPRAPCLPAAFRRPTLRIGASPRFEPNAHPRCFPRSRAFPPPRGAAACARLARSDAGSTPHGRSPVQNKAWRRFPLLSTVCSKRESTPFSGQRWAAPNGRRPVADERPDSSGKRARHAWPERRTRNRSRRNRENIRPNREMIPPKQGAGFVEQGMAPPHWRVATTGGAGSSPAPCRVVAGEEPEQSFMSCPTEITVNRRGGVSPPRCAGRAPSEAARGDRVDLA
jgi:hypothetical protein